MSTNFPDGFLWGAATSAYQIEGSPLADGAGPSIWHRFSHTPGCVADDDNGDVACDHYRRWPEDVALLSSLGLGAYRLSVSWSRVMPEGRGRVNQAGLDFYRRLLDALAERDVRPLLTIYHWDLPAALEDLGGWLNPDVAHWFGEYARTLCRALGDRVFAWATLNEPWVVTDGGYLQGVLAPGHRSAFEAARAAHNLLRAHAAGVDVCRAEGQARVGLVVNLEPKYPASDRTEDRDAAARAEAYMNRQYLDPALLGRYPLELGEVFGEAWPDWPDAEVEALRRPLDFLGVNYYTRAVVRHDPNAWPERASRVRQRRHAHTETGWEVYPAGLADCLRWVRDRYGDVPIYVTENGAAFYDPPTAEGEPADPLRVDYLRRHLRAVREALQDGVDVRGYFVWSLLDNLEWSHGFSKRFGLVHVDYVTQRRTPKASARFYADVARTNGGVLG